MRKILFTLFIGLLSHSIYVQSSVSKPKFLLRPYFENGIDFIQNDKLKQIYSTESKYFYGFGLQLGNSESFKLIPYTQYSMSKFDIENTIAPDTKVANSLISKQFTSGLIIPLKKIEDIYLRARLGYSYSMIKESFYNIDSNSHGFQTGFGLERKIIGNSLIYFDLSYNFQKTSKSDFRDFDMTKLSIGFVL